MEGMYLLVLDRIARKGSITNKLHAVQREGHVQGAEGGAIEKRKGRGHDKKRDVL